MTRVASITMLYALVAALVPAAPLAASEQPEQPEPQQAVVETVVAPPAEPEALAAGGPPAEIPPEEIPPEKAQPEEAQPVVAKAAPGTVTISDFEFAPASITVDVGDTVTWSNAGPTPHSATGDGFDTDIFEEGQSRSQTFREAGTFAYICTPHPDMKGTVIVRAAAAQTKDETGSAEAGTGAPAGDDSTAGDTAAATGATSVPTLPATGLDAGGLLALGGITLALGALLRRRTSRTG